MDKQDLGPEQTKDSGQIVDDLLNEIEPQDVKEYRKEATLQQNLLSQDQMFDGKSLPLTDELIAQIKTAVGERIKATAEYTKIRIAQIDENWQQHDDQIAKASDGSALSKTYFPEIYNNDEDWVDNLYSIFVDLPDKFEVTDIEDKLDEFMYRKMDISEKDETKQPLKLIRSLLKLVNPKEFTDKFGVPPEEKGSFYFQKKAAVKKIMSESFSKSGLLSKLEEFFRFGVVSGEFCCKDKYGPSSDYQLICEESNGNLAYKVHRDKSYLFTPIDTRLLIFPKKNKRWVIEKVHTTFSEVLGLCVDENNEPLDNAPYDIDMLKKVGKFILEKGSRSTKKEEPDSSTNKEDYSADILTSDIDALWDIDGDITLLECHYIPLVLKGDGGKKRPYKSLIHCFDMSQTDQNADATPEILPIGCRLTPYTAGLPYHFKQMIEKDGDKSGKGLPEKLKPMQTLLNDMTNHSIDIANLALWGIMVIDPDAFKETLSMRNLTARQILKLKDMKGRDIKQVMQWMHPDPGSLQMVDGLLPRIEDILKRTARKGPGGAKIPGKVTASEVQSIIHELQKNINKVALRLNELFIDVMGRMYVYTVSNRLEPFKVKVLGQRLEKSPNLNDIANVKLVEKQLDIDPKELMINGINFKLVGIDATDKKAVANQQKLQALNTLNGGGFVRNPDGSPHIMTDDIGQKVKISEYKIVKELLNDLNFDEIIENVKPEDEPKPMPEMPPGSPSPKPMQSGKGAPPLTASPQPGNVSNQSLGGM